MLGRKFLFLKNKEEGPPNNWVKDKDGWDKSSCWESKYKVKGGDLKLTISIGGFIQTNLATSLQDAIQKADSALYKSKHSGRNRVTYFDISKKKVLYREKLKDLIENSIISSASISQLRI